MVQFTFPSIYAGSQGLTWLWSPSLQDNTPTLNKRGIYIHHILFTISLILYQVQEPTVDIPRRRHAGAELGRQGGYRQYVNTGGNIPNLVWRILPDLQMQNVL